MSRARGARAPVPADEVDEMRIVSAWLAEHEPAELPLDRRPRPGPSGVRGRSGGVAAAPLLVVRAATARSAASNPILEWVLSQNGLVVEPPQRQSTIGSPSSPRSYSLPSASINRIGPVTL